MLNLLKELDSLVWGPPLLILLVGTGNIIGCGNGYQSWWPRSSLLNVDGSFFLEWQSCMNKDYLPLNTGLRMTMVRLRVVRCTISF